MEKETASQILNLWVEGKTVKEIMEITGISKDRIVSLVLQFEGLLR